MDVEAVLFAAPGELPFDGVVVLVLAAVFGLVVVLVLVEVGLVLVLLTVEFPEFDVLADGDALIF